MARIAGVEPGQAGALARLAYYFTKRKLGRVILPIKIHAHHPRLLRGLNLLLDGDPPIQVDGPGRDRLTFLETPQRLLAEVVLFGKAVGVPPDTHTRIALGTLEPSIPGNHVRTSLSWWVFTSNGVDKPVCVAGGGHSVRGVRRCETRADARDGAADCCSPPDVGPDLPTSRSRRGHPERGTPVARAA